MKRVMTFCLCVTLLLCGCGGVSGGSHDTSASTEQTETTGVETSSNYDTTGSYLLNDDGEAMIQDYQPVATTDDNRVFYEIFVGSFSDSNGDGTGDLQGIIERMDYLNDGDDASGVSLGIEGIWLSPIFASSSYHKYDVDDYYAIDPSFGTEDDLKELIDLCHERGVKIILDLVLNHTSLSHPWFLAFAQAHENGDTTDPYYDYYTYYTEGETPPVGRTFVSLSGTDIYYEGNFSQNMPELNYDNDDVRNAVLDVGKYYLDLGVDGFRFDAAKYIYFGENERCAEFWEWYMSQLRAYKSDVYAVAEVWDTDSVTDLYYPAVNCFDFTCAQTTGLLALAAKSGDVNRYTNYVEEYIERVQGMRADAMFVPFLANHDTDRAAGYLTTATGCAQVAANLYLLGPGSPFLYYGEEIGLRGSRGGATTDANRRLKMEWGDGDTVEDPTGADYDHERVSATAAEQQSDGDSLYSYYKKLILIRKSNPAIARGEYTSLNLTDTKLGGFTARFEGDTVMVLHNTTVDTVSLNLADVTGLEPTGIRAAIGMGTCTLDGTMLTLDGQTSVVLGLA